MITPISDSEFERLASAVAHRLGSSFGVAHPGSSPSIYSPSVPIIDRLANAVARRFAELTATTVLGTMEPTSELTALADAHLQRAPSGFHTEIVANAISNADVDPELVAIAERFVTQFDPLPREDLPIEKISI